MPRLRSDPEPGHSTALCTSLRRSRTSRTEPAPGGSTRSWTRLTSGAWAARRIAADTVNIADLRGGKIYPGNSALGEVTEFGANVTKFKLDDIVITHCNGEPDAHGYPLRIWACDQPDSLGWYVEEHVVGDCQVRH